MFAILLRALPARWSTVAGIAAATRTTLCADSHRQVRPGGASSVIPHLAMILRRREASGPAGRAGSADIEPSTRSKNPEPRPERKSTRLGANPRGRVRPYGGATPARQRAHEYTARRVPSGCGKCCRKNRWSIRWELITRRCSSEGRSKPYCPDGRWRGQRRRYPTSRSIRCPASPASCVGSTTPSPADQIDHAEGNSNVDWLRP
jgi:hypothetical protein